MGIHGKAWWLILCAMLSLIPSAASAICLGSPYPDIENVALQLTQGAKPSELATQDAWTPKSPSDASRHAAWLALAYAFSAAESSGATPSLGDLERQVRQAAGESDPQLLLALAIYRANTLEGARQLSHETSTIYTALKTLPMSTFAKACALGNVGYLFYRSDHPEYALGPMLEAYSLSSKSGFMLGEATSASGLAMVMQRQGDLDGALQYGNKAVDLSSRNRLMSIASSALLERGWTYSLLKSPEAALRDFEASRRVADRSGDTASVAYADEASCQIYVKAGQIALADHLCTSAIAGLTAANDPLKNQAISWLARVRVKQGRPNDALRLLKPILPEDPPVETVQFLLPDAYATRAYALAALGQYAKAFHALDLSRTTLRDAQDHDHAAQQASLRERFKRDEQEAANQALSKDLLVSENGRAVASTRIAYGSVMILLLALMAISVGWGRRSFKRLSMTDALTGLLNRRWAEKLTSAISSDRRARTVAALLDIDHFKLVNDCHGHASGDDVLKVFAGILKAKFRKGDIVARWGGEEFLVILRNCTVADACSLVAAARQSARELPWPNMPGYTLCFSAGIAAWPLKATLSEVVGNADMALYNAKEHGRDRTCVADHMPICG